MNTPSKTRARASFSHSLAVNEKASKLSLHKTRHLQDVDKTDTDKTVYHQLVPLFILITVV